MLDPEYDLKLELAKSVNEFQEYFDANKNIFKNDDDFNYLKRYLVYRALNKDFCIFFDCDSSKPVKDFYVNNYGYHGLDGKFYFDTYFSVQTLWGEYIENLGIGIKRSDFKKQLDVFDNVILKKADKKVLDAFNELAHYYHTIGNIAPCAPGINRPKGNYENNCYDRLDLFFEEKAKKYNKCDEWKKWYDENSEKYKLECFLHPDLSKPNIENPEELAEYINKIVEIIKKRGKEITANN